MIQTLEDMLNDYAKEYVRYVHISGDLPDDERLADELNSHVDEMYEQIHNKVDLILQLIVKEKLKI